MTAVYLTKRPGGLVDVRFDYNPTLVDLIRRLPPSARSWDKASKTWTILDMVYAGHFAASARECGHDVRWLDVNARDRASTPPTPAASSWADDLLKQLDPALRQRAIRALARVLHPDAGGSTALMQQLNAAAGKYTAERKAS